MKQRCEDDYRSYGKHKIWQKMYGSDMDQPCESRRHKEGVREQWGEDEGLYFLKLMIENTKKYHQNMSFKPTGASQLSLSAPFGGHGRMIQASSSFGCALFAWQVCPLLPFKSIACLSAPLI